MERTPGFRPEEQGLAPVRMALWAGFVFLTASPETPDLSDHLGNLPDVFGSHRLGDMVCTWRLDLDAKCNWKLLVENSMESYHTGYIHATTVGAQTSVEIATTGEWECIQVLDEKSIAVLGDTPAPFPAIADLSEEAKRGAYFSMVLPTTQFALAQDSMWWLQMRPIAPDRTILSLGGCFPADIARSPGFEGKAALYYERWRLVAEEDVGMLELQQRGLNSPFYRPGRLSWRDETVRRIDQWVMDRIPEASRPRA
jgi:phenylpropionate dioxygenase-like ring-hydroxylating dioxygenase large terminal subunit